MWLNPKHTKANPKKTFFSPFSFFSGLKSVTVLIVASKTDVASLNIAEKIISNYKFEKTAASFQQNPVYAKSVEGVEVSLVFINQETIWAQDITDYLKPQLIIFISRHSGVAGIPTLSVHTPGNLTSEAKFGGNPQRISISPAGAMKNALLEMARLRNEKSLDYEVSYECTHHGPSLDVPTMFAELGSSERQWEDLQAAEVVAHAIMAAVKGKSNESAVLGVGGPHYNKRFTEIALSSSKAFGHIIPKYATPHVDAEMILQCVERTQERVEAAVFDWKGMRGTDRERIAETLKGLRIAVEKA
jgi:D-aminoacyl-tRNA deacylase